MFISATTSFDYIDYKIVCVNVACGDPCNFVVPIYSSAYICLICILFAQTYWIKIAKEKKTAYLKAMPYVDSCE